MGNRSLQKADAERGTCDDDESWPGRHGAECECECCAPELTAIQEEYKAWADAQDDAAYAETGLTDFSPWPSPKCYGPHHWRRWRVTGWAAGFLYSLGVSSSSSLSNHCNQYACQGHPGHGWVVDRVGRPCWPGTGPYLLWMDVDWLKWYLEHLVRVRGHWPGPFILGVTCGTCAPWPCCGATGDEHADGCEGPA